MLLAATIIYASSFSRVAGPEVPGFDKVAHFFVYGLLGTLVYRVRRWRVRFVGRFACSVAIVSLFGFTDEIHQSFVPGRSSDWIDWLVDTVGAAAAILVYSGWPAYRRLLEFGPFATQASVAPEVATSRTLS
jgi:VanZ family protein